MNQEPAGVTLEYLHARLRSATKKDLDVFVLCFVFEITMIRAELFGLCLFLFLLCYSTISYFRTRLLPLLEIL